MSEATATKEESMSLTDNQQKHLEELETQAVTIMRAKYTKGALEHKTDLRDDHTISELHGFAVDEAIDQVTYLLTQQEKLKRLQQLLAEAQTLLGELHE